MLTAEQHDLVHPYFNSLFKKPFHPVGVLGRSYGKSYAASPMGQKDFIRDNPDSCMACVGLIYLTEKPLPFPVGYVYAISGLMPQNTYTMSGLLLGKKSVIFNIWSKKLYQD